ncbi:MAG: hypothetical protein II835_06750 [Fibrobacter sp.]|nr:hypothetical protein [Fibrobacter sp.]
MSFTNRINISFLAKAFLFLSCFEELLKGVRFGASSIKYLLLFAMIITYVFSKNHHIKKEPIFYFIPFYFYFGICFFFDFSSMGKENLAFIGKILLLPIWALIINKFKVFWKPEDSLCSIFVHSMVAYAIINPILYFVHLPIWNDSFHTYWGRISVGYPTVDAILIALALICIFFNPKLNFGNLRKIVYITILCLSIGIMASGSGMVYLFLIFAVVLFRRKKLSESASLITSITILIFLAGGILTYLSIKNPELTENLLAQVENRIEIIVKGQSDGASLNVNTIDIRKQEFDFAKKLYLDNHPVKEFFGAGFTPVTRSSAKGAQVFIESQYHFNMFCLGYLGMSLYILFFVIFQLKIFSWFWKKNSNSFWMYTLINAVFSLGASMTLVLLAWGIIVIYVYFVHLAYIDHKNNNT